MPAKTKPARRIEVWHIPPFQDVSETVRAMAKEETRSIANLVNVLLREAISARREQLKEGK